MKKEGLRRRLALCILENLGKHKITFPNVKRYITPRLLSYYNIRFATKITNQDIKIALKMVIKAMTNKPIPFRHAKNGSPWGIKREEYFLRTPLADLI